MAEQSADNRSTMVQFHTRQPNMQYIDFIPKHTHYIRWFIGQYGFIEFEIIDI